MLEVQKNKINKYFMAIAFCFLTIGDIKHESSWIHFFESIEDKSKYNIYINNKLPLKSQYFQKYGIKNPYKNTSWGTPSLVYATLRLFSEAIQNKDNEYFVLLSDSCIHVNDFVKVEDFIKMHDTNIFQSVSVYPAPGVVSRFRKISTKNLILSQASQWVILKRDFVEYCLRKILLVKLFGPNFFCLDEHFFIMMCMNGKYPWKSIDFNYTEWKNSEVPSPTTFSSMKKSKFNEIQKNHLFMRKVTPSFNIVL